MKLYLFLSTTLFLTACSSMTSSSSPVSMTNPLSSSHDPKQLFTEWMSSRPGNVKENVDYGIQYSFAIPYYEDTFLGDDRYKYPYKKEIDAVNDGIHNICKQLDSEYIHAIQDENKPTVFYEYDPASSPEKTLFYSGCINRTTKNFFVIKPSYTPEQNKFYVTLFTSEDSSKALADSQADLMNQHHNALVRNKEIEIENKKIKAERDDLIVQFQKSIKSGMDSQYGLVVEVKKPLAQVQTSSGLVWKKITDLEPTDLPSYVGYLTP